MPRKLRQTSFLFAISRSFSRSSRSDSARGSASGLRRRMVPGMVWSMSPSSESWPTTREHLGDVLVVGTDVAGHELVGVLE